MAEAGKVLFRLTDDALIAANSGADVRPFDRDGVVAVCYSCLSPKSDNSPDDTYWENDKLCADSRLPLMIREELSSMAPNVRKMHVGIEAQMAKNYAGRFELELLQNADDAVGRRVASELIGSKGMGFKSVLEITNQPEIHSGDFHFRLETLENGLRVPAECPPMSAPELADAVTVVRMPFRDAEAKKEARRVLADIRPEALLFCQRLTRLEIQINGEEIRILEIERGDSVGLDGGDSILTLKENGIATKWRRWSAVWKSPSDNSKQLSVAFCLQIREGREVPLEKEHPAHVFFPTNETIPGLKAMIHASYDLEMNRKHFQEVQDNDEAIRDGVKKLTADILKEITPSAALRTFGEVQSSEAENEIGRLQKAIADIVGETPFIPVIGGNIVCPAEASRWEHGLGNVLQKNHNKVCAASLLDPSVNSDKEAREILRKLGAKSVGGPRRHAELLQHCDNGDNEKCVEVFRVANKIMGAARDDAEVAKVLKDVPFWRTDNPGSPARALTGGNILLWRRPDDWPEWLQVDALLPEFTGEIRAEDFEAMQKAMGKDWPLDESRYFEDALVQFCEGQPREWWEETGESVLDWALKWGQELIEKDEKGSEFAEIIHLPTNNGWLPAIQCYFGAKWGGRKYFSRLKDMGVVKNPDKWLLLLDWLEVSRTLKVYRRENEYFFRAADLQALRQANSRELLEEVCMLAKIAKEWPSAVFKQLQKQLQNEELIPCEPGVLCPNEWRAKPGDVFMPGRGRGFFPEVDGELDETMREQLLILDVQDGSKITKEKWRDIFEHLAEVARQEGDTSEQLRREKGNRNLACRIIECYKEYGKEHGKLLQDMEYVPYLRQESSGVEFVNFAAVEDVRWMDLECYRDSSVYCGILRECKIFPLQFEDGRHFNLTRLSDNMEWLHCLAGKCRANRLRWKDKKDDEDGDFARFIRESYHELYCAASGRGTEYVPHLQKSGGGLLVKFAPRQNVRLLDSPFQQASAVYHDILKEFKIFPFQLEEGMHFGLTPLPGGMEWLHCLVQKMPPDRLRWDEDKRGNVARFIHNLYSGKFGNLPENMAFAPFLRQSKKGVFVNFAAASEVRWANMPYYDEPKVKKALLSVECFKLFPWFLDSGKQLGIQSLSDSGEIEEELSCGPDVLGKAEKLWSRYSERKAAFPLIVPDISGACLSRDNLRACSCLKLALRDRDQRTIVETEIDARLQDGVIIVNGKLNRERLWEAFADGLSEWMDKSAYRDDVENILRDGDWIRRLRKRGYSEEALNPLEDESEPQDEPSVDNEERSDSDGALTEQDSLNTDAELSGSSPDSFGESETESNREGKTIDVGTGRGDVDPSAGGRRKRRTKTGPRPPTGRKPKSQACPESSRETHSQSPRATPEQAHQKLQDEIHSHPEKIGLPRASEAEDEYEFPSEDKVDLLFTADNEYVAVEVKPRGRSPAEIERGAYQCVKYDALLKAAIKLGNWPLQKGRTIFALGGAFPQGMNSIREFLKEMGVEIKEDLSG